MKHKIPGHILPVIVLGQFAGTSLWFAGNAVVSDLTQELQLADFFVGYITMAVQAGFIDGTLIFAILTIADRYSPVRVFLVCALAGSAANMWVILAETGFMVLSARFITGFFLAGIYPVGMKIASDWHKEGLGKALGYLVGALVLGTAFPHLIKFITSDLPWRTILFATSWLATFGGILLYLAVPDGPFQNNKGAFKPSAMFRLFKDTNFRSAAFGYFGHMWELYAFWAFVPVMLGYYSKINPGIGLNIGFCSFLIIGIGSISCAVGGNWSLKIGSKKVASLSLIASGLCCLLSPFIFQMPFFPFMIFLLAWGIFVVSDSPQFSTLVAESADRSFVATGLTIVNSIGFAITILSIQLVNTLWANWESTWVFLILGLGPALGVWAISRYQKNPRPIAKRTL